MKSYARIITASSGVETPLRVPVVVAGAAWKWSNNVNIQTIRTTPTLDVIGNITASQRAHARLISQIECSKPLLSDGCG